MKALVLSADLGGNVPPTMAIARELAGRGLDVEVAGLRLDSRSPDASSLTEVDVSWAAKRDADGKVQALGPALARIFLSRSLGDEVEALIRQRRPDVVIVDCMALALIKGAERTGVPVVVLLHTFGEFWRRSFLSGAAASIGGALGFSPRRLWDAATLRLLVTDSTLDPARTDPELADYIWTGTTETGVAPNGGAERPRVLVSFSTTPLAGMRRTYRNAIEALSALPVEVLVTTGGYNLGGAVPSAPNVQIRGFVPHAEVLPGTSLVIGHGGHSTTMKVLAHGIPLLVLPMNPTADQSLIGDIVESEGLGKRLSARSDPARLRAAIEALLAEPDIAARAQVTGERLRAAPPGAQVAADRIIEVIGD